MRAGFFLFLRHLRDACDRPERSTMENYSIYLPSYSIGPDVYKKIPEICLPYGNKAVVIGGHTATEVIFRPLNEALAGSDLAISQYIWYGGEATYENVEALSRNKAVQEADMIFAVGGGKAVDTVKCLGVRTGKPVFTFPTIASNCAACTSVSIMYHPDGSFMEPFFFAKPPAHAFIQTSLVAASPVKYMRAGIGDTYAKYFESTISARGDILPHYVSLGVNTSTLCYEPLMQYGRKALEDMAAGIPSFEFEQTVLSIVVTTAIVSILVTSDHIIDYNTGLGHAVYYALTSFPEIEEGRLHGDLVAYGVLLLLLVDDQQENFRRVFEFNRQTGIPAVMADVGLTKDRLDEVIKKTVSMKDIDHNPYPITEDMVREAIKTLEKYASEH